jgi:hypothetical protein
MLDRPSISARVVRPIQTPIAAFPGDIVVAWPGHPTHALAVVSHEPRRVIHTQHVPDATLHGTLWEWYLDGCIRPADIASERAIFGVTDA